MRAPFFTSLLALTPCLPHLNAYKIDASCKDQDRTLVRDGANEAFNMADAAIAALRDRSNDPDVNRLFTLLFGQNPDIERVSDVYRGLLQMREEKDATVDISNNRKEVVS